MALVVHYAATMDIGNHQMATLTLQSALVQIYLLFYFPYFPQITVFVPLKI